MKLTWGGVPPVGVDNTVEQALSNADIGKGYMSVRVPSSLIAEMEAAAETVGVDTESLRVGESNELKVLAQGAGIFYTSPAPGEPDFVKEGDIVTVEQTLALTEAMKMFSQVNLAGFNRQGAVLYPEDKKYRIERILNSNGQQVSQGDLLFVVSPVED